MTRDEALMESRRGPVNAGDRDDHEGGEPMNRKHVLVTRGGMAVDLSDVRAVVEAMGQDEEDELYMLQWTEMLSWLRMASTVVSRLGGDMRRLPDETPDGEVWTVMSITE